MKYIYINNQKILQEYRAESVIVFGAGEDGKKFFDTFKDSLSIKCFIDNGTNNNSYLLDIPIYSFEMLEKIRKNEKIIITSRTYYSIIGNQLMNAGYVNGVDFLYGMSICINGDMMTI